MAQGGVARAIGRTAKRAAGVLLLFGAGSGIAAKWRVWKDYVTLPDAFVLELDLEQHSVVERETASPATLLAGGPAQLELGALLHALRSAKEDHRVRGLFAVLGDRTNFAGLAQLQELRNAFLDFRGRAPLYAYANAFGEGGANGTGVYYLSSAADKVFMPPTSCLSLLGFASSQVFVRGLLDKLRVQPEVFKREEYKSALASLTGERFDQPARDNLTSLLQSMSDQVVTGIASARRLPPAAVEAAIRAAPLLPHAALAAGLVDGLLYRDQVERQLLATLPTEAQQAAATAAATPRVPGTPPTQLQLTGLRVSLQRYMVATQWSKQQTALFGDGNTTFREAKPAVALVTAAGPIMQAAGGGPQVADGAVESHRLVRALRGIRDNPQVRAVVLRINSPGGSAVASDVLAREVELLVATGKPVIACLGDVAASGGLYIAAPASRILAQPGTVTGSIGVIFARIMVKDAFEQVGVTADTIKIGDNADWASGFVPLSQGQREHAEAMMDATYGSFLDTVARGRRMAVDAVRRIAGGRVFTGSQAVEAGLVDELGGVARALEVARELAGLPQDPASTTLLEWPPRRLPPLLLLLKSAGALPGPQDAWVHDDVNRHGAMGVGSCWAERLAAAAALVQIMLAHVSAGSEPTFTNTVPAAKSHMQQNSAFLLASVMASLSPSLAAAAAVATHGGASCGPQALCLEAEALAHAA